jgi:serine-type D-Ala-D-Ala carboxypeptidase/endopeptidase
MRSFAAFAIASPALTSNALMATITATFRAGRKQAAKKPYPDLIAERVLTPLSLSATTFEPSGDRKARLMQGHNFDGSAMPDAPTGEVIVGSGGLYSSPRDLLRWLQWHLDRMSNEGALERLIDQAAYLWRDGLNTVFGQRAAASRSKPKLE